MKEAAVTDFQTALTRLDDYVRQQEDDASVLAYEEELFLRSLQGNAPEVAFHAGVASTLRSMNSRGTLDPWITGRDLERVRASGLKTLVWEYSPETVKSLEIPPDADILITRIPLPLEGVRSIEAELYSADGRLLKRMPDILFDPADGAVFACCEADLARTAANSPSTVTKVWAVTDSGRRLVANLRA
jgi:hypothetical protein